MAQHSASPAPGTGSPATERPLLPVERVYVVRFADTWPTTGGGCHGQVEHVVSGRRQAFGSAEGLLQALGLEPSTPSHHLDPRHP